MAKINRFYQPMQRDFSSQQFQPNYELWLGALDKQQENFDKANDLSQLPIDALPGADTEYAEELRKKRQSQIDEAATIFSEQGVSAGNRYIRDLTRQVRSEYLPGGSAAGLKSKKDSFVKFKTEQEERFQKGELSRAQYNQSVNAAFKEYNSTGGFKTDSNLTLNGRQEQVTIDDFAPEFLKNFKANSDVHKSFFYKNGKMVYDKTKVSEIEAERVQKSLSQAYLNAAGATGQLDDEFKQYGKVKSKEDYLSDANDKIDQYTQLSSKANSDVKNMTTQQIKDLQTELKDLGLYGGKIDGKAGKNTKNGLELLKNGSKEQIEHLNEFKEGIDDFDNTSASKQSFITKRINELTQPYSDAKANRQVDVSSTNLGQTFADFKRREDYKNEEEVKKTKLISLGNKLNSHSLDPIKLDKYGNVVTTDGGVDRAKKQFKKSKLYNDYYYDSVPLVGGFLSYGDSFIRGLGSMIFGEDQELDPESKEGVVLDVMKRRMDDIDMLHSNRLIKEAEKAKGFELTQAEMQKIKDDNRMTEKQRLAYRVEQYNQSLKAPEFFEFTAPDLTSNEGKKQKSAAEALFNNSSKFVAKEGIWKMTDAGGQMQNYIITNQSGQKLPGVSLQERINSSDGGGRPQYKGEVTDINSNAPYGSIVYSVGNEEIYLTNPALQASEEWFANRLLAAHSSQMGVVEIDLNNNYSYQGAGLNLSKGNYRIKYNDPEHVTVERKEGNKYKKVENVSVKELKAFAQSLKNN